MVEPSAVVWLLLLVIIFAIAIHIFGNDNDEQF